MGAPRLLLCGLGPDLLQILSVFFKKQGHVVFASDDATLCMQELQREHFGAIVIDGDLELPTIAGLCKEITDTKASTRIVVVESGCDNETRNKLKELGVDLILQKPFLPKDLLLALTKEL